MAVLKQRILILISIIQFVNSQVLMDGICPSIPVQKRFNSEKFLGTWYEIERYYSDVDVNTKCNKLDFNGGSDGRFSVLTSAIHEKSGMPKIAHGTAICEHGDPARITLRMSPQNFGIRYEGSTEYLSYDYWILDTDYETYALVYSCSDVCRGRKHSKRIWILGRTGFIPESLLFRLYDRIKILGLDPKRLISVAQKDCVNVSVSVRSENGLESTGFSNSNYSFDRNSARKFLASLSSIFGKKKMHTYKMLRKQI